MSLFPFSLAALLAFLIAAPPALAAPAPQLVIYDNDWSAASAASLLPLLAAPQIRLLGLTTVSGDTWRDQGAADLRGFLRQAGVRGMPVVQGAVFPLVNTLDSVLAWERQYGRLPWKGAWNGADMGPQFHPRDPWHVSAPAADLPPASKAGDAADFLVAQVRAHPHQVTIYAAGPLTNIALALRKDAQFAALAGRLVLIGASLAQIKANDKVKSDFNFLFDPEAAAIVLAAPWASVVALGDAADDCVLGPRLIERIAALETPASAYVLQHGARGVALWDELGAALVADATLATRTLDVTLAVETGPGMFRGRARAWVDGNGPDNARKVSVVRAVDCGRFEESLLRSMAAPAR